MVKLKDTKLTADIDDQTEEYVTFWGKIKGNITKQEDLMDLINSAKVSLSSSIESLRTWFKKELKNLKTSDLENDGNGDQMSDGTVNPFVTKDVTDDLSNRVDTVKQDVIDTIYDSVVEDVTDSVTDSVMSDITETVVNIANEAVDSAIDQSTDNIINQVKSYVDNHHDSTKQDVLTAGTGISIQDGIISNTQTSAEWGNIEGNIANQEDLAAALSLKQDVDGLATVATSGDYNDLNNKPIIPTKLSELDNDRGFITNISSEIKNALLLLASKVAYIDDSGQNVYNTLEDSFYIVDHIDAVYTQGQQVIYPTTSLNDLRSGLVVTAFYEDALTKVITNYTLSGELTEGISTITVSYKEKTDTFTVNVSPLPTVESITAVYSGSSVTAGTSIDVLKTDLVVTSLWTDSSTEIVPSTDYTLTGDLSTAGTSTITVAYEGKTTTFNVTVIEQVVLSSISAVYSGGIVSTTASVDSLKSDLVVTAVYSDSTTETVASFDYILGGDISMAGTHIITVSYSGKTTTFSVTSEVSTVWKTFTGSDLQNIGLSVVSPYGSANAKRVAYVPFNIAMEGGYKYRFEVDSAKTLMWGIHFYTDDAMALINNNQTATFGTNVELIGWDSVATASAGYNAPASGFNGSPYNCMRFNFRTEPEANFTPNDITEVRIYKEAI